MDTNRPSEELRAMEARDHADPFDAVLDAAATGEGLVALDGDGLRPLFALVGEAVEEQREKEAADPPPDWPDGVEPDEQGVWGNCPVQCSGTVDGLPFYFRARGEHWSLDIAANPGDDPVSVGWPLDGEWERHKAGEITAEQVKRQPGWSHEEEWPGGPYAAGWMTVADAVRCITTAVALYRQQRADAPQATP